VVFIPTQQEIGKLCTSMQQLQGTWYCHRSLGNMEHRTLKQDRTTSLKCREYVHTYTYVLSGLAVEWPGANFMITIFCDVRQIMAKNWRFSYKPMWG
jgi:hypothetical protein